MHAARTFGTCRKDITAPDIYANVVSAGERAALLFVYGGQAVVRVASDLAAGGGEE
jgi:hypothetical protein